jgi:ribosomal protein L11 methylase PrmA
MVHAKSVAAKSSSQVLHGTKAQTGFSRASMMGMLDSLASAVRSLKVSIDRSVWLNYYEDNNYTDSTMSQKRETVKRFLQRAEAKTVFDLGANTGEFSRLAASMGSDTLSMDFDPVCVERNYLECRKNFEKKILPLVMDLTQPSPSLGWANEERSSLAERGKADAVMALALIHHLAIANNIPLESIARYFARLGRWLIIEFVAKDDSQVQRLLSSREDVFDRYTEQEFEKEFSKYFKIEDRQALSGSSRCLYLMRATDV